MRATCQGQSPCRALSRSSEPTILSVSCSSNDYHYSLKIILISDDQLITNTLSVSCSSNDYHYSLKILLSVKPVPSPEEPQVFFHTVDPRIPFVPGDVDDNGDDRYDIDVNHGDGP